MQDGKIKIGLVGNPNVGKSTVFNALTGMKQHTGNWPGKTVESAFGEFEYKNKKVEICDLPGTYSLVSHSKEEEVTRDFICKEKYDGIVIVCDAVCLERNLNLVLQVFDITKNVIVCVNLIDEAKKKKIKIDYNRLSKLLGVSVIPVCARKKLGLKELQEAILSFEKSNKKVLTVKSGKLDMSEQTVNYIKRAEEISKEVVIFENKNYANRDRKIDKILTNKLTGVPIMLAMLGVIFWITLVGANYPSELLISFFNIIGEKLYEIFEILKVPEMLTNVILRRRIQSSFLGCCCYASTNGNFLSTIYTA